MGYVIGTSGWSYKHWREVFYPNDVKEPHWLDYYARHFHTVEINNSFYHLPRQETYRVWREGTPTDFTFAVKASRYITHIKRLRDAHDPLKRFFEGALELKEKLGVVLFQLPPGFKRDDERLRVFLHDARDRAGASTRMAFEFRDRSWLADEVYLALNAQNAALAFADWGGVDPMGPVTADFVYVRRHGPLGDGRKPYPPEMVAADGTAVIGWMAQGLDVYAYYNNDYGGHALKNASQLARYVAAS